MSFFIMENYVKPNNDILLNYWKNDEKIIDKSLSKINSGLFKWIFEGTRFTTKVFESSLNLLKENNIC